MATDSQDFFERSLIAHEQLRGKIGIHTKLPLESRVDLSPLSLRSCLMRLSKPEPQSLA
ncbi:MAG: hypothetical protein M2R45_03691 [Verrucomicrobia subdivision 3 bacterium]|nr:hypothetical protein [Limisphaerales bacterium]MCS1414974.1 hypothetical protein [Limisphaerales bacterium]